MNFSNLGLKTKVILSVCIPTAAAIIIGIVGIISFQSQLEATQWVNHTHHVIERAEKILGSAVDMETGMRGYLLTGKEVFLEPYISGEKRTFDLIRETQATVSDNPLQVARLGKVEAILSDWQKNVSQSNIDARRRIGEAATINELSTIVQQARGKQYFDRFREEIAQFIHTEQKLLENRDQDMKQKEHNTIVTIIACLATATVLGVFYALFMARDILRQIGGEPALISLMAQNVAKGNLDFETAEKEASGVLKALIEMITVLRRIVTGVDTVVRNVSEGRLFQREESSAYSGTWEELVTGINNIVDKLTGHLDQIPAPFIIIDKNFNILATNKANCEWIGRSREQIIGEKCHDIMKSDACRTEACASLRAMNSNALETGDATACPAKADLSYAYKSTPIKNRKGDISGALEVFTDQTQIRKQEWIKAGQNLLNEKMQGEQDTAAISGSVITFLSEYIKAQVAAIYIAQDDGSYRLINSYAYMMRSANDNLFRPGQGMIGQAALEKKSILFTDVPEDHVHIDINSGLGESRTACIYVIPLVHEARVLGVMAFGSSRRFDSEKRELLDLVAPNIAISINTAESRVRLNSLLDETRRQQEELKASNEELEEQTQRLKESQEKLKAQQEELEMTNEELEEKNLNLEEQKKAIKETNRELDSARQDIEQRAEELAVASKYKSEFLANMSHELRTPLNSLLLLARFLTEDKDGNLNEEQLEAANIVYNSGNNLLSLINEILDLSKIEAGQMTLQMEDVSIRDLASEIDTGFRHMAKEKGLELDVAVSKNAPGSIYSDRKRVDQILKNLISNAIKFTDQGKISVNFNRPAPDTRFSSGTLVADSCIAIAVSDSGIGIPDDMQRIVFEAFQQVEGGSARKYGGTGLGLSISRELAALLGGEIALKSEPDVGSTFTLFLPVKFPNGLVEPDTIITKEPAQQHPGPSVPIKIKSTAVPEMSDDRENITKQDTVILVIEDDVNFARLLANHCHGKGFKCLLAVTGEDGLQLAEQFIPHAVILDIRLPGIDGWSVLDALKENTQTRHIPVHIMSVEDATIDALKKGAVGFLTKPAQKEDLELAFTRLEDMFSKKIKNLLIVEDDDVMRKSIIRLIGNGDVHTTEAATGAQALEKLKSAAFDCMILDLGLPDMTGFDVLKKMNGNRDVAIPPVIIYTGKELTLEQEKELYNHAETIIIKGVKSEERLLDETSLFLHRVFGNMPAAKQQIIRSLHDTDLLFQNKQILVVDDDMRNVFALSRILEAKGMTVLKAEDGKKGLEMLASQPDIDLILMDIMMPVMDGYETMKRIRAQETFSQLPIIALTAKAMIQDREQCIACGANDYLTKPVDVDRLFSMMRVWLYR